MRFIDTLSDQQYERLCRVNYTRKPGGFAWVETRYSFDLFSDEIQEIIQSLPIIEVEEGHDLFDDFLDGAQQFYVLKTPDNFWLVDTQGYDYARYVVLLSNYQVKEVEQ